MAGVTAFAPGRVNLIGEHTDYNGGLCLPFAIERGVTVVAEPLAAGEVEVLARDLGERDRFSLGAIARVPGWRAYVRGAASELVSAGHALRGTRLEVRSELPAGGGLASSAALTIAAALALLKVAGQPAPGALALARLCSRVENEWAGARTGLLDQLAILCAGAGHAVRIDAATASVEAVPLALGEWTLRLLDSGVRHAHAEGGYNERRAECRRACELLGIRSLRDASFDDVGRLPPPLDRRLRHVLTENARVERMVDSLRRSDRAESAALLDEGHASLRDDYAVSVPAVEETRARLKASGAAGARMVGGGFGGLVLGLFPPGARALDEALPVSAVGGVRVM
jgi:galactokinase